MPNDLMISTTFEIPGYRIVECKGLVTGLTVRSPTWSQGFFGGLKSTFIGGNIAAYKEMCEQARDQASVELTAKAQALGANAVVGFTFDATEIGRSKDATSATEVVCYGTAVRVVKSG